MTFEELKLELMLRDWSYTKDTDYLIWAKNRNFILVPRAASRKYFVYYPKGNPKEKMHIMEPHRMLEIVDDI